MLTDLIGAYVVDLQASSKLLANSFSKLYPCREEVQQALEHFLEENKKAAEIVRLLITANAFVLKSEIGSETYPIINYHVENLKRYLDVMWDGHVTTFEIQNTVNGTIRLFNEANELSHYAWSQQPSILTQPS